MNIVNWLYPQRCPMCDELVRKPYCCPACYSKLTFVEQPYCYQCGQPLELMEQEYCADCQKHPKSFEANKALLLYDDLVKESLARFKFHNRREYAAFYAEECVKRYGDAVAEWEIDAVIPVPVHPRKKRERGYNQAALFGKEFAQRMGLPFWKRGLERSIYTLPQKELNNVERLKNLEKAFHIGKNNVKLKKILVVDDIYTTGATLEACSRVLIKGGAARVYTLTVAIGEGY